MTLNRDARMAETGQVNDAAYEQLIEHLARDDAPAAAVVDLVLAAAEGAETLEAHLDGGPPPARRDAADHPPAGDAARVYLEQIAIQNFRGIGPAARLPLAPGPGLTLVVGRNGSGKSSFAEGLELLLTGENLRWEGRTQVWRTGWRNLHADGPTVLLARFRVDGESEPLELRRRWPAEAALDGGDPIEIRGPRESWDALAWEQPLARYRPLLSYNELGTMFSERASALYEALSAVLGLQDFEDLSARLRDARLAREKSTKGEKAERTALKAVLAAGTDPRASDLAELLGTRAPDLAAVERFVTGEDAASPAVALQPLAAVELPAADELEQRFATFDAAAGDVARLEATGAERLDALAGLLAGALSYHEAHGDERRCPVCGTADVLDEGWSLRSQAEVQQLRRQSEALRDARRSLADARRALGDLHPAALPAWLRAAGDEGVPVDDAHAAWDRWAEVLRADVETLRRDGPQAGELLLLELATARDAAAAEVARRDGAWRPTRDATLAWLATARRAEADAAAVVSLRQAEAWVKALVGELRRERLAPVVTAAQGNWAELRHESNVALGEVELRKEGNRRYAAFDVTVDGTASSAFGVMSQGELSALAVSVFLPRASLPESPFGFMVIDDPVQSMDPAKVDGLARVLAAAAAQRQVIVFTHDERLTEAVRRLGIDARIATVQRRAASKVEVVAGRPPSDRYVGEAFALAKTQDVPDEVRARAVPSLCGQAIEAACAARIRRRLIESGTPHAEVERILADKTSLHTWLAAAFDLSTAQGTEITERVRRLAGDDAVDVLSIVRKGRHRLVATDGLRLAEGTRALVQALERP
jgi:energy-coupling factor transporter ATP-binding protein EcfA2